MSPPAAEAAPERLGERLKAARLSRRVRLEDAAQATKIRTAYLDALEGERWNEFPAEVYLVGFLKRYAQFLGLSPDEAGELLKKQNAGPAEASSEAREGADRSPSARGRAAGPRWIWLLVLFAALAGALHWASLREASRISGPEAAPDASALHVLSVTALRDAWVSVSSEGRLVFEGIIPAASLRTWRSPSAFLFRARRARDLRVEIDGAPADLREPSGREIRLP